MESFLFLYWFDVILSDGKHLRKDFGRENAEKPFAARDNKG
jgi:hypothetical protein